MLAWAWPKVCQSLRKYSIMFKNISIVDHSFRCCFCYCVFCSDALEQRCDTLEAQNRNLLERNQLLHKKSKVLSATAKEQGRCSVASLCDYCNALTNYGNIPGIWPMTGAASN